MKDWMSGSATIEEVSSRDDHCPNDKNADYVCGKCRRKKNLLAAGTVILLIIKVL
jgi:hypothetical protein